tara:strand:- start:19107 stop:22997 length:3891 start_codon:yes stop_codon:yes gene_type:complete
MFINKYISTPSQTTSNFPPSGTDFCSGSIEVLNVSGLTSLATVSWTGPGGFTSDEWNITNLCVGSYTGISSTPDGGDRGQVIVDVSGYTLPVFSAGTFDDTKPTEDNNACITDPTKFCKVIVYSAASNTGQPTLNYSLYKDGELFREKIINSGDTRVEFSDLPNGLYTISVGDTSLFVEESRVSSACSGSSEVLGLLNSVVFSSNTAFSSITSADTVINQLQIHPGTEKSYQRISPNAPGVFRFDRFAATLSGSELDDDGRYGPFGAFNSGIWNNGIITNDPSLWLYTGSSPSQGVNINEDPNTGRTTDNSKYWYLGQSAFTETPLANQQGTQGPDRDLAGNSFSNNPIPYVGSFYYNTISEKFMMLDTVSSGGTGYGGKYSDYAWRTIEPLIDAGYSGNPTSSTGYTALLGSSTGNRHHVFRFLGQGGDTPWMTGIEPWGTAHNLQTWYDISNTWGLGNQMGQLLVCNPIVRQGPLHYISPCHYNNYEHKVYFSMSGNNVNLTYSAGQYLGSGIGGPTTTSGGLVLAAFKDDSGLYGTSGVTHTITLELDNISGATVYHNKGNEAHGFQRSIRGREIVDSDYANPESVKPTTTKPYKTSTTAVRETTFREFSNVILRNWASGATDMGPNLARVHDVGPFTANSYYYSGTLDGNDTVRNQGQVYIGVSRTGQYGQHFKIQMTKTMMPSGAGRPYNRAQIQSGSNRFYPDYEINFNLMDKTTWSGSAQSAPSWTDGTELYKFLGGTRVGYTHSSNALSGVSYWYGAGFTGTPSNSIVNVTEPPLATGEYITLTDTSTANIESNKSCDYFIDCERTVPKIKPKPQLTIQDLVMPDVSLSGFSPISTTLDNNEIYDKDKDTGRVIGVNLSGNTTDLIEGQAYFKLGVFSYNYFNKSYNVQPDFNYIFDTLQESSGRTGISLSGTAYVPFSALPTSTSWEYLVKPSLLYKDKTTTNPVWIDTYDNSQIPTYEEGKDSYFSIIQKPNTPNLGAENINYPSMGKTVLVTDQYTVGDVPTFSGGGSGFSYSAISVSFDSGIKPIVTVNGIVMKAAVNSGFTGGDYYIDLFRLNFRPRSVRNGDNVQLIYPSSTNSGWHYQSFSAGTIDNDTTKTIYKEGGSYYVNLEYDAIGSVALAINGTVLMENRGYRKTNINTIQIIKPAVSDGLISTDIISLYYLTPYSLLGKIITKNPTVSVKFSPTPYFKETLELVTYNESGTTVQSHTKTYSPEDFGTDMVSKFKLYLSTTGKYTYKAITKRYYPTASGKEIVTMATSLPVSFELTQAILNTPDDLRTSGAGTGGY